jgi:hypothetical protein
MRGRDVQGRYVLHAGLTPRSCVGMRMFADEKTIFAMHKRTSTKSGGREPAVGMRNTIAQTQARLFAGPPTVYVRIAVAFVLIVATGG